jgi:hypothetical protein
VPMLRYRNLRTLAAVSAKAENTENTLQRRRQGCIAAGLFALAFVGMTSTAASAYEYLPLGCHFSHQELQF